VFIVLNQWTAPVVIQFWGKDPGKMVMDEWAGMLLSLGISIELLQIESSLMPSLFFTLHFALFRVFDIIKPLGINRLQNFSGGLGILLDDLAAGIYTSLAILLISQII
jgi:phosphatidylglycerophosphatase A